LRDTLLREKDARSQFALLASAARNTQASFHKTHAEQEQGAGNENIIDVQGVISSKRGP